MPGHFDSFLDIDLYRKKITARGRYSDSPSGPDYYQMRMTTALAWIAFVLGTLVCLVNFYSSFLRYPIHRLRGLPKGSYRWESGIPLVGSLCVALSLLSLHSQPVVLPVAIILIAVDTGGLHWFIGVLIYNSLRSKPGSK